MKNYDAWDIKPVDPEQVSAKELYRNLAGWAVLAANAHNVQPWRFILRPQEKRIDVCVDPAGVLPASDKRGRQAHISVGCAIENLMLAAEYYGLAPECQYAAPALYPAPTAKVFFKGAGPVDAAKAALLNAMKQRRMNRGEYDSAKPLGAEVLAEIRKAAEGLGLTLHEIGDPATRFAIAEIQYLAGRAVVARTDFRKELGAFLLPNDTASGKGMPGNWPTTSTRSSTRTALLIRTWLSVSRHPTATA